MSPWFRSLLDQTAEAKGLRIQVMRHMHSVATLRDLVEQGVAPTILPYGVVMREVANRSLRALRIVEPEVIRDLCLLQSATRPISSAVRTVKAHIEALVSDTLSGPSSIWQPIREPNETGIEQHVFVDGLARMRLREAGREVPTVRSPKVGWKPLAKSSA